MKRWVNQCFMGLYPEVEMRFPGYQLEIRLRPVRDGEVISSERNENAPETAQNAQHGE
jgi:hypothetical protein